MSENEIESFALGDEAPVPENGVARPPSDEPRPPKPEPKHRRKVTDEQRAAFRAPVRPEEPPRDYDEGNDPHHPGRASAKAAWPAQYGPLWLIILEWLKTGGKDGGPQRIGERDATPDDVMIGVQRIGGGGQGGGVMFPDPIEGGAVCGDENESGDVVLGRVLTDTYHLPLSDKRSRATFRLKFYWRSGGRGDIKWSEPVTLPSPEEIIRSRAARVPSHDPEIAAPVATTMADGRPLPPGTPPEVLIELGSLREFKLRQEGKMPPAVPVPPPAVSAGGQPADWQARLDLEKRVAVAEAEKKWLDEKTALITAHNAVLAALQKSLTDLEAKQKESAVEARMKTLEDRIANPPPPPAHEVEARYLAQLAAHGIVTIGPDGKPAPMKTVVEGLTLEGAIAEIIQDPVKYAKLTSAYASYRETVRRVHGLEEPHTEVVPTGGGDAENRPEPTVVDKAFGFAGDLLGSAVKNPEGPLTFLATLTKGSPAGEMFQTMATAASAGRAAVSAARQAAQPPPGATRKPPSV